MRLVNFTDALWLDEIWSMIMSSPEKSVGEIINACKVDTHPPLFDILLHFYLKLFGDDPLNGRVLSLLIGFLGMFATFYHSLRISKNYTAALIAFGLVSLSFFHVYYSDEGRFYTFLYILSLSVISRIYLYFKEGKSKHLVFFTISSTLIVYTHYYGIILLLAVALILLFLWFKKEIDNRKFIYSIISGVIVLLLFAPWLPFMFSGQEKESWMHAPSLSDFFEYFYNYTGKNPVEFLFLLFALFLSIKLFKKNVLLYSILYGTILLGFLIPFAISVFKIPMLHIRYTIIYFPSIILINALFWSENNWITERVKRGVYVLVVLSIFINFFFINDFINGANKESWGEIANDITKFNYEKKYAVYSEQNFYLNYFLDLNEDTRSSNLPESISEDHFWYLATPYDEKELNINGYLIKEKWDYEKGFILKLYSIKTE